VPSENDTESVGVNRLPTGAPSIVPVSVVLELPAEKLERDRRIGGQLTHELASVLTQRHNRDFKDSLPDGMQPRYAVHAARDVPAGHVRVRLGPAIHVPQQGEVAVWKLQTSLDGVVWDAAAPILLTEQQRLFILSGSVEHGSQVCAHWPFDPKLGLVLLNLPGESRLDVSSEPLGNLAIGWNDATDCHVVRIPDAGPEGPCLYLRASRLQPVALPDLPSRSQVHVLEPPPRQQTMARAAAEDLGRQAVFIRSAHSTVRMDPVLAAVQQESPGSAATPDSVPTPTTADTPVPEVSSSADPTATHAAQVSDRSDLGAGIDLGDAPTLVAGLPARAPIGLDDTPTLWAVRPVLYATLSLEGLAVQRPSLFAEAGVRGVQWGLDAAGGVVAPQSPACALRFSVSEQDELRVATAVGSRVLAVGEAVPLKGGDIVLRLQALPAPLTENYLGWLHLPLGRPARIEHGKSVGVGRQLESLKALQPLAGNGFLTDVPGTSGDRMGLSRRHFELQATADGLVVRPLGANTVAHLDEHMHFVATVTAEQPALLASGQCLLVGHYVWRFNA